MRHLVSLLLVFVYLASPLAGTSGLVVCYGTDGHAEVELAVAGSCRPLSVAVLDEYCGPCKDVALVSADGVILLSCKNATTAPVASLSFAAGLCFSASPFTLALNPRPLAAHASLRSAILLI